MTSIAPVSLNNIETQWRNQFIIDNMVQVLYSTPDQSNSGSACHMTKSANRHSVVI